VLACGRGPERCRPTSAPSTPSTSGTPAARGTGPAAGGGKDLLDFLVSTPAILEVLPPPSRVAALARSLPTLPESLQQPQSRQAGLVAGLLNTPPEQGPLQGPLWSNPKSKVGGAARRLVHTPLTPASPDAYGEPGGGGSGTSSMLASPAHGWRYGGVGPDGGGRGGGGGGMPLAFTAVDDLSCWLQHNKALVASPGAPLPCLSLHPCVGCALVRGRRAVWRRLQVRAVADEAMCAGNVTTQGTTAGHQASGGTTRRGDKSAPPGPRRRPTAHGRGRAARSCRPSTSPSTQSSRRRASWACAWG